MTTTQLVLEDWATQPLGKAARVAIAVGGMIIATLVLLMATMLSQGVWLFVLVGFAMAATSIRAAQYPTLLRLGVVSANLLLIPLIAQLI